MLSYLLFLIIALIRIFGIKTLAFQATAHIVFGLFLGIYFGNQSKKYLILAILLTLVEILCFFFL